MDTMSDRAVTTNELMEVLEFLQENMVTKADLKEELRGYPTKADLKEELKAFATKEDLKGYPTKADLREELKAFATKDDLNNFRSYVVGNMLTKEDAEQFATKTDLSEFRDEVMTTLDGFTKQQIRFDHELTAVLGATRRHEDRLDLIEQKIGLTGN